MYNDKTPNSSPPDLIRLFVDERRLIFLHLQRLRHAMDSINRHGFSSLAFEEIASAIRFINYEIHAHTENEESILFPTMEQYLTTLLLILKNEHKELLNISNKLATSVNDIENGCIRNTTIKELVNYTEAIVGLLENHLQKEETLFFPFIKKFLSDEEHEQLTNAWQNAHNNGNAQRKINSGKSSSNIAA
jgi:hemerythrin-like domain-containing protein